MHGYTYTYAYLAGNEPSSPRGRKTNSTPLGTRKAAPLPLNIHVPIRIFRIWRLHRKSNAGSDAKREHHEQQVVHCLINSIVDARNEEKADQTTIA